ncbi:DUF427-domain-containing protein [Acephala macrosclerotiorum]|nr:DUF427-domain-containing protein [Acephala macrosclerotiorum]
MAEPITKSPVPDLGLQTLASTLITPGPHKVESTPRRVRALFGGKFIVDAISAKHVWEHKYFPHFWVPITSVVPGILSKGAAFDKDETAFQGFVTVEGRSTDRVMLFEKGPLEGLVRFDFKAMDAWFEEDTQIYDHPKNPYTRIDILSSSRQITIKIANHTIASSSSSMFLFETGLRPRYYLPKTSVNFQYLTPSSTTTKCPYKGLAQYYNVTVEGKELKDVVWWYEYPTTESAAIQGLVCFYNEKVDVFVDGVLEEK